MFIRMRIMFFLFPKLRRQAKEFFLEAVEGDLIRGAKIEGHREALKSLSLSAEEVQSAFDKDVLRKVKILGVTPNDIAAMIKRAAEKVDVPPGA